MSGKLRERSASRIELEAAISILRSIEALAQVDDKGLEPLADTARRFDLAADVEVIVQGRFPSGLFVVDSGSADVFVTDVWGEEPTKVNTLMPGAHFGEIGLIEGMPSTATVRTAEPSSLIRFQGREFLDLIAETPGALLGFLGEMSGAMARTDPRYRFAVDERTRGAEDVDLENLKLLAGLASQIGPALRPYGRRDILDEIATATRELFEAAACSIAVIDGGELVYLGASGEGSDEIRGLRLPVERGVAGAVFRTGESVAVPDVARDERFDEAFAGSTGYVPTSLHAVRLETEVGPVGVLQVLDAARVVDGSGLRHLEVFAGLAALVIQTGSIFSDLGGAIFSAASLASEGSKVADALDSVARDRRGSIGAIAGAMVLVERLLSLPGAEIPEALDRVAAALQPSEDR